MLMWGHQEEFTLNKGPWDNLLSQSVFAYMCVCVCVCVYTGGKAKKEAEAMDRRNWEAPGTQMDTL